MNYRFYDRITRAPEGDGAPPATTTTTTTAPPATTTPPAAGATTTAPPATTTTTPAPPAATTTPAPGTTPPPPPAAGYRPDGLPDHLAGQNDKETIDKLFKSVDGFRRTQAERGEVPAESKAYTLTPSDSIKPYIEKYDSDPVFAATRDLALKHGLTQKQFDGFVSGWIETLSQGDVLGEPYNPDRERAALMPDEKDPAQRTIKVESLVRENIARVTTWKEQGLPDAAAKWLLASMDRAGPNQLTAWIAARGGEATPALSGINAGTAITEQMLNARVADPRGRVGEPKYDPDFAAETTRLYKAKYPDTPRA